MSKYVHLVMHRCWLRKAESDLSLDVSGAVALRGEAYCYSRRQELEKKAAKSTQTQWKCHKTQRKQKKCHHNSQKKLLQNMPEVFWGDNNMTEQLRTWQASSKCPIPNKYLQYYMNHAFKTHDLHLFLSDNTDESTAYFKCVTSVTLVVVRSHYCLPKDTYIVFSEVSSSIFFYITSTVFVVFFMVLTFSVCWCFLKSECVWPLILLSVTSMKAWPALWC